jgi:predicted nuclease of predicted toxin-antitoxin system
VSSIRLLADIHISPITVAALKQAEWDIIRVSDVLPTTTPDHEILEYARQENRVVVTQDLDFSMLVALGGYSEPSLITLRLSRADPNIVTQKLLEILPQIEQQLQEGCAITVEDENLRIRRLPIR